MDSREAKYGEQLKIFSIDFQKLELLKIIGEGSFGRWVHSRHSTHAPHGNTLAGPAHPCPGCRRRQSSQSIS